MAEQNVLVSVLMVSYNSSEFISEAIESVLAQSYTNFELVICDDNSPDNSWEIISQYTDSRIVRARNENNLGEYQNRNKAMSLARGEYLIFIDADDILYKHGLEFMMRYAVAFPEAAMVISRPWDERILLPVTISSRDFYRFEYLDSGISGINFTKLLFKSAVAKQFPFPKKVKLGDLWIQYQVAAKFDSLIIPDASTWWRRRSGQASEKLLNDLFVNMMHELWIRIDALHSKDCPLSDAEKEIAFLNVYGNYFRFAIKEMMRLRFGNGIKLLKAYPIPSEYWRALFKKQQRGFFNTYNGNKPLKQT
jgi:glycosyltransferase involved in cell wall biosynthesis